MRGDTGPGNRGEEQNERKKEGPKQILFAGVTVNSVFGFLLFFFNLCFVFTSVATK